jgi:ribosomal protein S18 acetylase RimI-like enzyme
MLTRTHQLSQASHDSLKALLETCQRVDASQIPVYPHLLKTYRPGPPSLLFHNDKQELIGFLALFHFYPNAAEVACLVHPTHRKQGIAHTLWHIMCNEIQTLHLPLNDSIVSSPSDTHKPWLEKQGFCFQYTEYSMRRALPYPDSIPSSTLIIRQACHDDIPALCLLDAMCFNRNRPNPTARFKSLFLTPNTQVFVAFDNQNLIGQVHLIFEDNNVRLTDLAIHPTYQHQGFGRILFLYALDIAYKQHYQELILTVEKQNQSARCLYQNTGFKIYNAVDYYKRAFSLDRF